MLALFACTGIRQQAENIHMYRKILVAYRRKTEDGERFSDTFTFIWPKHLVKKTHIVTHVLQSTQYQLSLPQSKLPLVIS